MRKRATRAVQMAEHWRAHSHLQRVERKRRNIYLNFKLILKDLFNQYDWSRRTSWTGQRTKPTRMRRREAPMASRERSQ